MNWVNRNGGIAGRKVVPVIHETDPTRGTFSSQGEAACADFTEDHQVFAAGSTPVGGNDSLAACMAKKGRVFISQQLWLFDDRQYQEFPTLYQPGRMSGTRWGAAYVDGLRELKYFNGAKVGLVRFDGASYDRVAQVVKQRMARYGLKFTDEVAVRTPDGVSDFGGMNAEFANAILRFRGNGVSHIMFIELQGTIPFFFMKEAESQGYRPKYGLPSQSIPATQAGQQDPNQLRGSVGVGWIPAVDLYVTDQPRSANRQLCIDIMKQAGLTFETAGYSFYTHSHCDTLFFLKAALERAPALTTEGLRVAAERLGSTWNSPLALSTRFAPGRRDGAAATQNFVFRENCECYRYVGTPRPVP